MLLCRPTNTYRTVGDVRHVCYCVDLLTPTIQLVMLDMCVIVLCRPTNTYHTVGDVRYVCYCVDLLTTIQSVMLGMCVIV